MFYHNIHLSILNLSFNKTTVQVKEQAISIFQVTLRYFVFVNVKPYYQPLTTSIATHISNGTKGKAKKPAEQSSFHGVISISSQ